MDAKERFREIAPNYDKEIVKIIPYYKQMIEALINIFTFNNYEYINILDLGCGTGSLTQKIKEKFPNSRITCMDSSKEMINLAKKKLWDYDNIKFIIADFSDFNFNNDCYDVVLSSLAIHNLIGDEDKKNLYRRIYKALKKNGFFYIADFVSASSRHNQRLYDDVINNFVKKNSMKEKTLKYRIHREDNVHPKLVDQIKWFEKVGFREVDIVFKYYTHAVFGGRK
ncbi:MAG: class I SAM-dependent methyltransferase [Methanobrevibacter sp.]|nr:class I SAM-dependent methyltransferase [Methanobrevibacter sp.]